jgi:hypothetical protein
MLCALARQVWELAVYVFHLLMPLPFY